MIICDVLGRALLVIVDVLMCCAYVQDVAEKPILTESNGFLVSHIHSVS